ncbi:hypothetical protein JG687_00018048 [Phytophthora cactorum]|uniref:Uncharacterized protein n=1 Tax=Phytophthora cactorum TaxID=29920 RepID=A0A329RBJ5_9STRA|nr:hypothetical protein GQ600_4209 [Phytophthora cactorum]KAG2795267.1 hypothetical protein PC111_g22224 [Phytophthora cactorum]KAG2874494.1 hypothetical protein PC114_g25246 [Phytophthora cactorum]KAG2960373.1 hypothetical protein PC118_g22555 [Phytophthora cactorum]KAG2977198.1 hypothetical protein PC119_g21986 [Phytophthora cactorum]
MNKRFDTWEQFEAHVKMYLTQTHQTFYKRSSMTLQGKNKKIKESYARIGREAHDSELLLDKMYPHYFA